MKTLYMTCATCVVQALFVREMVVRVTDLGAHAIVVRAVTKTPLAASYAFLLLLTAAQAVCCVTLSVPALYGRVGALSASAALAFTCVAEALSYDALSDFVHVKRVVLCVFTVFAVGLFRKETQVRSHGIGTPIHDRWVNVHSFMRKAASGLGVARLAVPLGVLMIARSLYFGAFRSRGVQGELSVAIACNSASLCAICMVCAGLDSSDSVQECLARIRAGARSCCGSRRRGKKKAL